jgi:hypothetical protein
MKVWGLGLGFVVDYFTTLLVSRLLSVGLYNYPNILKIVLLASNVPSAGVVLSVIIMNRFRDAMSWNCSHCAMISNCLITAVRLVMCRQ